MTGRLVRWGLVVAAMLLSPFTRRLGAGEPEPPAPADAVSMTIQDVKMDTATASPLVILQTAKKDRVLVVVIGATEAIAILRQLREEEPPPRPMTHDLLKSVITRLGGRLRRIVVTGLVNGTFHAELVVERGETLMSIDSRPSDALALALRMGAPIFVARKVLDEAGMRPDQLHEDEAPKRPRRPAVDPDRAI